MHALVDRLTPVLAEYRAHVSSGRFDLIERQLQTGGWLGSEQDLGRPPTPEIVETGDVLFDDLRQAVERRDHDSAVRALSRLRVWLHRLDV